MIQLNCYLTLSHCSVDAAVRVSKYKTLRRAIKQRAVKVSEDKKGCSNVDVFHN